MRTLVVFCLLATLKILSRLFYRLDLGWVGEPLPDPWARLRLVAFLNHTSLYEVIYFAGVPFSVLWHIARRGVVPGADKTLARPIVGRLFRLLVYRMVPITRRRDQTWDEFMKLIGPDDMVLIAPEGRMMRPSGLDLEGRPMTVRGGIVDILEALGRGRMLIAYSAGLHHVQAPGEALPRLFRRIKLRLEVVEIETYRDSLRQADTKSAAFRKAVIADLEARRARYCR